MGPRLASGEVGGGDVDARRRRGRIILLTVIGVVGLYWVSPEGMSEPARRTLCLFVAAAVLWSTEVIALYATSLCVLALQAVFLAHDGGLAGWFPSRGEWPVDEATGQVVGRSVRAVFAPFASPIIILFMGGFLLATAMARHGIDRVLAGRVLEPLAGHRFLLLAGVMGTSGFLSMWMSNTATTAMMLGVLAPLLRGMREGSRYAVGLVLAVPFGANLGGIGTPIGTPPNAVALAALRLRGYDIGFVDWMVIAVPLAVLLMAAATGVLWVMFRPVAGDDVSAIERPDRMTGRARMTMGVMAATVALWLTEPWHGLSASATALLAAAGLTALGVLDRRDVDSIDWNVLILMWGGLSLGEAMEDSGLVAYAVGFVPQGAGGVALASAVVVVSVALSTFMSNTAAAALIVPVAMAISPGERGELAILTALSCSFAMAMPVSTPPNAMAFATGRIPAGAMLRAGVVIAVIAAALLLGGFEVMLPVVLR